MRILSWNINSLNSHKLDMHDTVQYIEAFKAALLTETRSASYEQGSTACSDPAQAELLAAGQRPAAGRLRISVKIQI